GEVCRFLQQRVGDAKRSIHVLGPVAAPLSKIKGKYRWQLLIKGEQVKILHSFCKRIFEERVVDKGWKFQLNETARINYGSNGVIETSLWHPFFVWDGMYITTKRADELVPGDWLLKNGLLDIQTPERDSDLWWLIGYIIADGCFDNSVNGLRLRIFDQRHEILERANRIISQRRGTPLLKLQKDPREDCFYLQTTSKKKDSFVHFLYDIVGPEKLKPSFTPDGPLSFIAGLLDGDGHFGRDIVSLYTASDSLKDFICEILSKIGINYKVRTRTRKRFNRVCKGWEIAFGIGYCRIFPTVREPRLCRYKPTTFRKIRVKSVEILKEKATLYDFTVPLTENYLAGTGHLTVVHNTGFAFSRLRPKDAPVGSTGGVASGPVSFMRIFDTTTDVIKQGGVRRGANMGVLRVDHPDILEFIRCKADKVSYRNFNISVAVTDKFMEAYFADEEYELIDPHTRKVTEKLSARFVFEQIAHYAWLTGDPGILFIDRINQAHPLKGEEIEATNPCGEVPLLGYECCVLGSINLSKFVKDGKVDYKHLGEVVALGVRFLDNVIDANKYPFNEIDIKAKAGRKIGLGIMGFAEMLIQLGVPYDSKEGLQWGRDIMRFINERARKASSKLAKLRGNFELKGQSKIRAQYRRNATVNTIAPTGSIGIIAGTSSGIEPLFGISYVRVLAEGVQLHETNKYFEQIAKEQGFWDETLAKEIAKTGSVQHIDLIPAKVKALFKTAHEIPPEQHVRMQAAFQEHVDNAVSKTVNLPNTSTPEAIRQIYLLAWELGCKGITVFRDGCLDEQVLYKGDTLTCELDDPSCPSCSG
ncbi:MAG: adenosylcobalamin-dependent ribonucleoside-diphosphate reductase, partial [Promethearchaeota archaeon]